MTNALQIYDKFDTLQRTAIALQSSGYFKDVASQAQAIVKVMAGAELGLPPFASMAGIHIVQGKPVLGSNVIATLVKNDPRYDYRVKVSTDTECVLTWYEDGKVVGESSFTMVEAQNAGLTGKAVWKQYPSDLLFARAVTRGARRFAPGVFGGAPVYTPEELNVDVDEDGYIEGVVVEDSSNGRQENHDVEPAQYEEVKSAPAHQPNGNGKPVPSLPDKLRKHLHAVGTECYGDEWDDKRAEMSAAFGVKTSNEWDEDTTRRVIKGMQDRIDKRRAEQPAPAEDDTFGL